MISTSSRTHASSSGSISVTCGADAGAVAANANMSSNHCWVSAGHSADGRCVVHQPSRNVHAGPSCEYATSHVYAPLRSATITPLSSGLTSAGTTQRAPYYRRFRISVLKEAQAPAVATCRKTTTA